MGVMWLLFGSLPARAALPASLWNIPHPLAKWQLVMSLLHSASFFLCILENHCAYCAYLAYIVHMENVKSPKNSTKLQNFPPHYDPCLGVTFSNGIKCQAKSGDTKLVAF